MCDYNINENFENVGKAEATIYKCLDRYPKVCVEGAGGKPEVPDKTNQPISCACSFLRVAGTCTDDSAPVGV